MECTECVCTIAPKLKAACEHRAGAMGVFSPDPREQRLSRQSQCYSGASLKILLAWLEPIPFFFSPLISHLIVSAVSPSR